MSNLITEHTPELPRNEVFTYPPLNLRLTGITPRALALINYGENPKLNQEIEDAVAELSLEPEWLDPVASFRKGGTYEEGPALVIDSVFHSRSGWRYGQTLESYRTIYSRVFNMFHEVGFRNWHVFLDANAQSGLLKELDERLTGGDPDTLCRDLTNYWYNNNRQGTLHHFLGSATPLTGPAFSKLLEWYDSIEQTLSEVERESGTRAAIEILPRITQVELNKRLLYVGHSLYDVAPKKLTEAVVS